MFTPALIIPKNSSSIGICNYTQMQFSLQCIIIISDLSCSIQAVLRGHTVESNAFWFYYFSKNDNIQLPIMWRVIKYSEGVGGGGFKCQSCKKNVWRVSKWNFQRDFFFVGWGGGGAGLKSKPLWGDPNCLHWFIVLGTINFWRNFSDLLNKEKGWREWWKIKKDKN